MQRPRSASVSLDTRLSSIAGTQADEGSTAASDHPRAICTYQYLRGSTSASSAGRKRKNPPTASVVAGPFGPSTSSGTAGSGQVSGDRLGFCDSPSRGE